MLPRELIWERMAPFKLVRYSTVTGLSYILKSVCDSFVNMHYFKRTDINMYYKIALVA